MHHLNDELEGFIAKELRKIGELNNLNTAKQLRNLSYDSRNYREFINGSKP